MASYAYQRVVGTSNYTFPVPFLDPPYRVIEEPEVVDLPSQGLYLGM